MHGFTYPLGLLLFSLWSCSGSVTEAQAESPLTRTQSSPAVEMQPGQTYAAGTRLRIPKGNASFVIPVGWHAQLPEDSERLSRYPSQGRGSSWCS